MRSVGFDTLTDSFDSGRATRARGNFDDCFRPEAAIVLSRRRRTLLGEEKRGILGYIGASPVPIPGYAHTYCGSGEARQRTFVRIARLRACRHHTRRTTRPTHTNRLADRPSFLCGPWRTFKQPLSRSATGPVDVNCFRARSGLGVSSTLWRRSPEKSCKLSFLMEGKPQFIRRHPRATPDEKLKRRE